MLMSNGSVLLYLHTATLRMSGSLQKSAEIMKSMHELVKVSDVAASMRDMSREMMKVKTSLLCCNAL